MEQKREKSGNAVGDLSFGSDPLVWISDRVEARWKAIGRRAAARRVWWWALGAGLALRIVFICITPLAAGDLMHRLVFGRAVVEFGLSAARASPEQIHREWKNIIFSDLPYAYPAGSLLFFWGLAAIWPTLFFGRLVLTIIEAINAWLIYKITGRRLYAAIYWLAPVSIFWVSREGQFEPLQNLFTLFALMMMKNRRLLWAWVMLMLAIQIKITPIFLVPWFVVESWRHLNMRGMARRIGAWVRVAAAAAAGLLPTALTSFSIPLIYLMAKYSSPLRANPYYWNFFYNSYVAETDWLVRWNSIYTYGVLLTLLLTLVHSRDRWAYVAPLGMLGLLMLHHNILFWYTLVWPPLLLPIREKRVRTFLFVVFPLFELWSLRLMLWPYDIGLAPEKLLYLGPFGLVK